MNRDEVQKYIEERYPGFKVLGKKTILCRNSRIFMLDLCKGQIRDKIVVKIPRNYQPREVALEFANLSRFYHGCKDEAVSSPQPLFVDAENGILAMSYVQGVNLSHMLHEIRPASSQYLSFAADLSGIALAKFHKLFRRGEDEPVTIDFNAHEDDINQFLSESREGIGQCNLKTMVTPFIDFTSWNIIIKNDHTKNSRSRCMILYLIDFPRLDYVCTPHLDLARFRFGLELVKQFPPAKFFGLNRWDVDSFYDRFLSGYCREMHVVLSRDDLWLIARARKAYIRRAQDLTRKGRCGWQPKLEQAYLQTFSREWLDQGDVFSKWPRMGRAEKA
ncbi:MAG: hypothetical protein QG575_1862 [Euryarchaeota archaeon]|nr:hypothetical protein [Euryarchaeota archaeon]